MLRDDTWQCTWCNAVQCYRLGLAAEVAASEEWISKLNVKFFSVSSKEIQHPI